MKDKKNSEDKIEKLYKWNFKKELIVVLKLSAILFMAWLLAEFIELLF